MPNTNTNTIDAIKSIIKNETNPTAAPSKPADDKAKSTASFSTYNFPEALAHTLLHMKYETPTPVQIKAIPLILDGRDILASAQTGTGKTGAFSIPIVAKLLESSNDSVLVLTPTRELASQVMEIFHQLLGRRSKINTALLIGGDPIVKQFRQLQSNPRVIVGTPGRVNDHLMRRTLKLHDTKYLVLDETDRMLDMGFDVQIEEIIRQLPKERQTLMFSATIANRIASLAKKYQNNPERVDCGASNVAAPKIKQENIYTSEKAKYEVLTQELAKREGSVIIFVKTKRDADELASRLRSHDHRADAIHGDLQQRRRERVISDFRKKLYRIMVATDVASRGLDIPHIEHVINFNLPHCPEDYIHRIGRTARAGAEGSALNLISPEDDRKWKAINRLINPGSHNNDRDDNRSSRAPRRGSNGSNGGNRPYQNYGSSSRNGGGNSRGGNDRNSRSSSNSAYGERRKYGSSNGTSNTSDSGRRTYSGDGAARKSAPFFPQRKDGGAPAGRNPRRSDEDNRRGA